MIVMDASALVEALLGMPAAEEVEEWLFDTEQTVHVPHLLDIEVTQVVRKYTARGDIAAATGRTAVADLANLRLYRHSHELLLPRVWELRANLTAYDAVYVALAEALDAPLVTRDRRIAAAPGHHARVEVI
jgi:predicted nucleic acid-binding protein